ncbi:hypothetical protein RvY_06866 [Ramazzottius varieornatus]|uniref:DOMON domain-containing protein n=1 Tax=Ramazzottius varieornatus TaxID=947166 RepID=A0A1D1V2W7_RAMVA|nr:hypothetical protein RvY_06866 [Ramazzottius varieornatus]
MASSGLGQILSLLYWSLCGLIRGGYGEVSSITLNQETFLDPDQNFFLRWGYNSTHIDVEVTAQTLGWLSVAISPNGGMDTSDGMIAWVEDSTGEVTVQDRWLSATKPYSPKRIIYKLDAQQDWVLVSGSQNATHTTIRAIRRLVTCDSEDRPFTKDTVRLLFALHPEDPIPWAVWFSHHAERGTRSLMMLSDSFRVNSTSMQTEKSRDLQQLNIVADKVSISATSRTMYYCSLIKLPTFSEKRHVITTQPVVTKGNEAIVHHVLAYLCKDKIDDTFPERGFDCTYDQPRPMRNLVTSNCTTIIGVFGIGSEPYHYPAEAGFPLTPEMSGRYVFLENHYDNPNGLAITDSSGIRLTTTTKLRPNDAATMMAGYSDVGYSMMIPPKVEDFVIYARCTQNCTVAILPDTGVKIINVLLHTHLLGRKLYLRQIRKNKELAPIAKDEFYDFNYQESQRLNPPRVILPGDELIMECHYNSLARDNVTFGGWGTPEEMCMAFVTYYPATPVITFCSSETSLNSVIPVTGTPFTSVGTSLTANETTDLVTAMQDSEAKRTAYKNYMSTTFQWTQQNLKAMQNLQRFTNYSAHCISNSSKPSPQFLILKPGNYSSYREASTCPVPGPTVRLTSQKQHTSARPKSLPISTPPIRIPSSEAGVFRTDHATVLSIIAVSHIFIFV